MRFPAGSVNLDGVMPPGTTHTLSMLVIALPLSATMISNSDTAMAKQVKGVVERCTATQRNFELALKAEERFVNLLFVFQALVLDFEIEVAFAEDVLVLNSRGAGFVVMAGDQVLAELAAQAAGEADEAPGVLGQVSLLTRGLR